MVVVVDVVVVVGVDVVVVVVVVSTFSIVLAPPLLERSTMIKVPSCTFGVPCVVCF